MSPITSPSAASRSSTSPMRVSLAGFLCSCSIPGGGNCRRIAKRQLMKKSMPPAPPETPSEEHRLIKVPSNGSQRLDKFLVSAFPHHSPARLQALIKEGFVLRSEE